MTIINPPTPFAYATYCDEVRTENTGKEIYIGVYGPYMILNGEYPFLLPNFAVIFHYWESPSDNIIDDLRFTISLPGDDEPTIQKVISRNDIQHQQPPSSKIDELDVDPSSYRFTHMKIVIHVTPAIFKRSGRVRCRVYLGDLEIRAGTLAIMTATELQNFSSSN